MEFLDSRLKSPASLTPDFHLYLETAPSDQYSDRWANRPFRAYTVVHPPSPVNLDPVRTQTDKARFLENLWNVQAMCRTKDGRSDVRVSVPREMDSGKKSVVRTWFNVYKRTDWLKEPKKVCLHHLVRLVDPRFTKLHTAQNHSSHRSDGLRRPDSVRCRWPSFRHRPGTADGGRALSVHCDFERSQR